MINTEHTEEPTSTSQKAHTGEPSGSPDADFIGLIQEELNSITQVATESLRFTRAAAQMGMQEAGHALAGLPSLVILWLSMWQLALVTWITVVGLAGWLAYSATQSVALAITASIILQVIGLGVCAARIAALQQRFNMQRTKALLATAKESLNAKS